MAINENLLLISDDAATVEYTYGVGNKAVWSHLAFGFLLEEHKIDDATYIRWTANLIDAGHSYITVTGKALALAAKLDLQSGESPGYLFKSLAKMVGGSIAEPNSHISVCQECLMLLWGDLNAINYRAKATSYLLERLIAERNDQAKILRTITLSFNQLPLIQNYIIDWLRGHFLLEHVRSPLREFVKQQEKAREKRARKQNRPMKPRRKSW